MRVRDSSILIVASGLYVGLLIVANVTGGKLFDFAGLAISAGSFAYIACLAVSDVLVDVYGTTVGYRLVRTAAVVNVIALCFQQVTLRLPIAHGQEVMAPHFAAVFGATAAVIIASIIGFPITDTFETWLWQRVKRATGGRHLWLRNLVVKVPGQLLDATVFFSLAFFVLPMLFSGEPLIAATRWWDVMRGAWAYGLWKGVLGTCDYPLIRAAIPWVRGHRLADIPALDDQVVAETGRGSW
jgi:uncharacterized integral membrane protein (TIGR00697 family)